MLNEGWFGYVPTWHETIQKPGVSGGDTGHAPIGLFDGIGIWEYDI